MKKIKVSMIERPIEYFSTMGCRTVNGLDVNAFDNFKQNIQYTLNKEFDKIDDVFSGVMKDGRGNVCPCTIILPTIAMESKLAIETKYKNYDEYPREELLNFFMDFLDKKIGEAKDMLIERFNHICSQKSDAAKFMWENKCMAGYHAEEGIRSALKHGTIVIGQLGMAEALQILLGTDHSELGIGMETAKRIEQLFLDRTSQFKKEYKLNFGVYYTPAENLCYTAMKKFRQKYGIIKNVSDHEYFTNSIHVPVWKDLDAFTKIDIESELTGFSNAGCITYVEVPSTAINNIDAIESLVDYAMEKDIPYFALNFPLDYCEDCGAQGDFNGVCPKCGSTNISELRRVTGYLSTTKKHFNKGKQAECDEREKHFKN